MITRSRTRRHVLGYCFQPLAEVNGCTHWRENTFSGIISDFADLFLRRSQPQRLKAPGLRFDPPRLTLHSCGSLWTADGQHAAARGDYYCCCCWCSCAPCKILVRSNVLQATTKKGFCDKVRAAQASRLRDTLADKDFDDKEMVETKMTTMTSKEYF